MKSNVFWREQYSPVIDKLSGSYDAYDIYTLSRPMSATGTKFYFDAVKYGGLDLDTKDDVLVQDTADELYTLKSYYGETAQNQDFNHFKLTFPHYVDINRFRRFVKPKRISASSSFKDDEEEIMMAGAHPQSDLALNITTLFRRKKALMFFNALNAEKAGQSKDGGVDEEVPFPAEQMLKTKKEVLDLELLAEMQAMTAKNMTDSEQWYVAVSPTQKQKMITTNQQVMFSRDFAEGSLTTGNLPRFMNFVFISHPLMELPQYQNKFFAFTKTAIVEANFSGIKFNCAPSAMNSFEYLMLFEQNINYARRDDGKVIQGTLNYSE